MPARKLAIDRGARRPRKDLHVDNWRTCDDFGPYALTDPMRAAMQVFAGSGEDAPERWLVAVAAMGNAVQQTESMRSIARRVGRDDTTVKAWCEEWMAWARLTHEFGTLVFIDDAARAIEKKFGAQAAARFRHETENMMPGWETRIPRAATPPEPREDPDTGYEVDGFDDDDGDGSWDEDELESATEAHEAG